MLQKDSKGFFKSEIFVNVPNLVHGYSTRTFGNMKTPTLSYKNFFQEFQELSEVNRNRMVFASALGTEYNQFVYLDQVHDAKIFLAKSHDAGMSIQDTDSLLTQDKDLFIFGTFADCLPILFFYPKNKSVGLCHAGWRGTIQKIAPRLIEEFKSHFDANSQDLFIGFGPSIGVCCYEVKEDVEKEFKSLFGNDPKIIQKRGSQTFLDLRLANYKLLLEAGCNRQNIDVSDLCTFCRSDIFYSHRKESKNLRGEMAAVIGVKNEE